jgi:hypothetical protein
VSKPFFVFGRKLMTIVGNFSWRTIGVLGNKAVKNSLNDLLWNESLRKEFFILSWKWGDNEQISDIKVKYVLENLMTKTFHAWAGAASKEYKERFTGRHAKGTTKKACVTSWRLKQN